MKFTSALLTLVTLSTSVSALTAAQWRGQSVYQVLTDRFARTDNSTSATCDAEFGLYCGGTWQGIINKLDYIQNMGFTAIWISPVVKQLEGNSADGSAYHGYWAQDIYSLNSHFGTEADLLALSDALHKRKMYLMVDVVTNHMAYLGAGNSVDYSILKPFNKKSQYHDFCLIDYNNVASIKNCWMGDNVVSLPDLRNEDSAILNIWTSWIANLVSKYKIDGIRLDSAQQLNNAFLAPFEKAAGVYVIGEVFNGNPSYTCAYQKDVSGLMNFPAYFWIRRAFESTSGSISELVNGINTMKSTCADTTLLGSFMENHDVTRFASVQGDFSLAKNAIAFTMLADGIPIIYEGQEQHYSGGEVPYNRDAVWFSKYLTTSTLYTWISQINQIRNQAIYKDPTYLTYKAYPTFSDANTIVMRKGFTNYQIIGVFSNLGANGGAYTINLNSAATGFTANQQVVEIGGCTTYTVDGSGNLAVKMASGLPRIFYPRAPLVGSGVCRL
ncbi:hypothetical protein WAI453_003201 [Rhynchosporium graminicola]|uniref:alpha-amylase n=1 Tax=Rhynchosporium graminicola TaxID=2792576 RepID=A0A1E1LFN0_9HELO|nr:related to alpha-amylase A precursor [Rhynchosporium commune]